MKTIGIIVGSNRPKRRSIQLAPWLAEHLTSNQLEVKIIDLAEVNLPFLDEPETADSGHYQHEHTKQWSAQIQALDGIVLLYPQYNWGYPAVLKNALDYLYTEWAHKPVSNVVFGGRGGFQASTTLRFVLQGLHMNVLATNLSLSIAPGQDLDPEKDLTQYLFTVQQMRQEFEHILNK